jgi:hypothetical protein
MWTQDADIVGFPLTWKEAHSFVGGMNRESAFNYQDWKLPSRGELFGLISHANINPALPSGAPFNNVFSGYYWTETACSRLEDQAWYIHLGGGRIYRGMKHGSYMVWPMRRHRNEYTASSIDPRRSDPSDKANRGRAGRYVFKNGSLYDRATRLGWADMNGLTSHSLTWMEALNFVRRMNASNVYGHGDWRLPNIRELESIIDLKQHTPALSTTQPGGRVMEGYWSSTTSVYEPRYAWVVYMQDGAVGVGYKKHPEFHAWAVRGGST